MAHNINTDELLALIDWTRSAVSTNWSDSVPVTPDRRDAWLMEAYEHVAIVRHDLKFGDDFLLPSLEILACDFQWSDGHPAAWFSGLRHANFVAWDRANRAWTAQKIGLTADAKVLAKEAEKICLSMADSLLSSQQTGHVIGHDQIVNRWAGALAIAAWARSTWSDQGFIYLLDRLMVVACNQITLPNVIDAIGILVPSALIETSKADAAPERQRLIKMAEPLLIRDYSGINEDFNRCSIAGTIALIIPEISKERRIKAFSTIIDLLRCARHTNTANLEYATYNIIKTLHITIGDSDLENNHYIVNELLETLLDFDSADVINVLLNNLKTFNSTWSFLSDPLQLKIFEQAWCVPRRDLDVAGLARLIPALRAMAEWSGSKGFHRCWEYAVSAGDAVGILWADASKAVLKTSGGGSKGLINVMGSVYLLESLADTKYSQSNAPIIDYFKTIVGHAYADFASDLDAQLAWACGNPSINWEVAAWSLLVGIAIDDPMSKVHGHYEIWAKVLQDLVKKHPPSDRPSAFIVVRTLLRLVELTASSDWERSRDIQSDASRFASFWLGTQNVSYNSSSLSILDDHLGSALLDRWMTSDRLTPGAEWARTIADRFAARSEANGSSAANFRLCAAYVRQWSAMIFEGPEAFEREVFELKAYPLADVAVPKGLVIDLPSDVQSGISILQSAMVVDALTILEPWQETDISTFMDLVHHKTKQDWGIDFKSVTVSVATSQVGWWPEANLFRVRDAKWPAGTALYFAQYEDWLVHLDGTSRPIHGMNSRCPIQLSEITVLDYLHFFTSFVQGEQGSFYLVDDRESPLVRGDWAAVDGPLTKYIRRPTYLGKNISGNFICWGTILYDSHLSHAEFEISSNGFVNMLSDCLIAETGLSIMFSLKLT